MAHKYSGINNFIVQLFSPVPADLDNAFFYGILSFYQLSALQIAKKPDFGYLMLFGE